MGAGSIHDQTFEGDDGDIRAALRQTVGQRLMDQRGPLLETEQGCLAWMNADRDDQPVGDVQRLGQNIQMAVGHGVEGAGIKSCRHALNDPPRRHPPPRRVSRLGLSIRSLLSRTARNRKGGIAHWFGAAHCSLRYMRDAPAPVERRATAQLATFRQQAQRGIHLWNLLSSVSFFTPKG